jgi:hypothetical protein
MICLSLALVLGVATLRGGKWARHPAVQAMNHRSSKKAMIHSLHHERNGHTYSQNHAAQLPSYRFFCPHERSKNKRAVASSLLSSNARLWLRWR